MDVQFNALFPKPLNEPSKTKQDGSWFGRYVWELSIMELTNGEKVKETSFCSWNAEQNVHRDFRRLVRKKRNDYAMKHYE